MFFVLGEFSPLMHVPKVVSVSVKARLHINFLSCSCSSYLKMIGINELEKYLALII